MPSKRASDFETLHSGNDRNILQKYPLKLFNPKQVCEDYWMKCAPAFDLDVDRYEAPNIRITRWAGLIPEYDPKRNNLGVAPLFPYTFVKHETRHKVAFDAFKQTLEDARESNNRKYLNMVFDRLVASDENFLNSWKGEFSREYLKKDKELRKNETATRWVTEMLGFRGGSANYHETLVYSFHGNNFHGKFLGFGTPRLMSYFFPTFLTGLLGVTGDATYKSIDVLKTAVDNDAMGLDANIPMQLNVPYSEIPLTPEIFTWNTDIGTASITAAAISAAAVGFYSFLIPAFLQNITLAAPKINKLKEAKPGLRKHHTLLLPDESIEDFRAKLEGIGAL